MNQEEYLDQLLEMQRHSRIQPPGNNGEITASLAAAEKLTQLQKIDVPADFTSRLEASLRTRVRSRRLAQSDSQAVSHENVLPLAHRRDSTNARRAPRKRAWLATLGMAAMLMLAFTSLLALSAHTHPGSPPSGTQQVDPQATSPVGNDPQSQARSDIALLQSALDDLRTAVNNQRGDAAIKTALKTVTTRTTDCRNAVTAVPAGPEHDAAQENLNTALAEEEHTLRQLLAHLDWPMQLLFTRKLGTLGDPVPIITDVKAVPQSNGTFLITLTGEHFDSQARLMFNGRQIGTVSLAVTTKQLVAIIHISQGPPDIHAFGILNLNGTAAQFANGDDHRGSGTSTPYPDS